jgi:2'-hydroxyisoflavone reductase
MQKILILGGTKFIGRNLTERLIDSGQYDITLFNRGKSNAELFGKHVKQITGDRETEDIQKLSGIDWDCVIDFSAYYPVSFERLLSLLKGRIKRYIFISTISVYDISAYNRPITEADATVTCSEAEKTSKLPDGYGAKKVSMEQSLLQQEGLDKIIFRPSFIYGKYDWTERFYYWLYRAKFSNSILLPDAGTPVRLSLTNAADLTEALMQAISIDKHQNIYNTISQRTTTLRDLITAVAGRLNRNPEIIGIDKAQMEKLKLQDSQFPLCVPFNFEIDDSRWKKDFKFQEADMINSMLEIVDYKAQSNFPEPPVGLSVKDEQAAIIALKVTKN